MPDDISRRELLRGRLFAGLVRAVTDPVVTDSESLAGYAADGPGSQRAVDSPRYQKSFPVLRPPGAIEEQAFLAGCTRCNQCIEACPYDAIVLAPPHFRRAAGTPMIDAAHQACWMCPDRPCITACEPGVLRREVSHKMGTASVDVTTCLAHQGSFCTVCSEQCPVEGAIELTQGKPRVNSDVCTGCGVCFYVCPAPAKAILLIPTANRPPRPATEQQDQKDDVA